MFQELWQSEVILQKSIEIIALMSLTGTRQNLNGYLAAEEIVLLEVVQKLSELEKLVREGIRRLEAWEEKRVVENGYYFVHNTGYKLREDIV